MNFTKDYISLCKNGKVQGLRKKLEHGDWVFFGMPLLFLDDGIIQVTSPRVKFEDKKVIWLPTSGQLDQHIIEQLDDGSDYIFIYTNFSKEAGHYNAIVYEDGEVKEQIIGDTNPLIAKIKLLISLLEEE
jgi:hypothetical protein